MDPGQHAGLSALKNSGSMISVRDTVARRGTLLELEVAPVGIIKSSRHVAHRPCATPRKGK